jgi:ABC-type glycerol-3-phosphate transport system permease component
VTAVDTPAPATAEGPRDIRRKRPRLTAGAALVYFSAFCLAAVWLLPLLWALSTSFKTEAEVRNAVTNFPTWKDIVTKALPKRKKAPETEEQKYAKAFRAFVKVGHREMDRFDPESVAAEDMEKFRELARRFNTFLKAIG